MPLNQVKFEPVLLSDDDLELIAAEESGAPLDHIYRMKAVDALNSLENALIEGSGSTNSFKRRPPGQDLRFHLLRAAKEGGPLATCDPKLINEFVECYYHARHEPLPVFDKSDYEQYMGLLDKLIECTTNRSTSTQKSSLKKPSLSLSPHAKNTSVTVNGKNTVRIIVPQDSREQDRDETSV
jgi:hypothetical protein